VSPRGDKNRPVGADFPAGSDPPGGSGLRAVLRDVLDQTPLRAGVTLGRLVREWEAVVGPELAARTAPRSLQGGVLVVAASAPAWAVQVRFLAREIARAADHAVGQGSVREVRVIVHPDASKGLGGKGYGEYEAPPEGAR
jgi:predicted nucleic acid-binding Zn ribbon protein